MKIGKIFGFLYSLWERMIEPKYAISILVVISSAVRLLPMRFKYLLGYDPYFHLAYIRYALEKGEWVRFFPYLKGPFGSFITDPLGLWMVPAYLYKLLSPLGISLYNVFRITPVIFGVLTIVFIYLSILLLYGKKEAFLSAFFLSVMFGHIFRSVAGYYRGDNYMVFWYSVALFSIVLAMTKTTSYVSWRSFIFHFLASISLGISSIFWKAYYPIFGFLLMNSLFLGIGAFLLKTKKYLLFSIITTLDWAVGALLALFLGERFHYGMFGPELGWGRWIVRALGLNLRTDTDVFLLIYLKYIIPVSFVFLLSLLLVMHLKSFPFRFLIGALVVIMYMVVFVAFIIHYHDQINVFINKFFESLSIAETQRTKFQDMWEAYGISMLFVPFFLLRLVPSKIQVREFLLLGTVSLMVPMILLWTRFLFIGSVSMALLAGVGLSELHDSLSQRFLRNSFVRASVVIFLSSVLVLMAIQGFQTTVSIYPILNENWENGLLYLGHDSNINDVVLDWWDHSYWITYYSNRSPIGNSKLVAQYYLGVASAPDVMSDGVDYVVVSYDALLKYRSILEMANLQAQEYSLLVLHAQPFYGTLVVFSNGPYSLMAAPGEVWDVKVNLGGRVVIPERVFVEDVTGVRKVSISGRTSSGVYAYINLNYGYAVIMNDKAFNTPLSRLMFTDEYPEDYEQVYSDGGIVKIFRFDHPNVAVTAEGGLVVLKFTNATGTNLGIYGYLDNGTLVFKKWYEVGGKSEFVLPENMNGSVVVRYVYTQKKRVFDRGVFRLDDVLPDS